MIGTPRLTEIRPLSNIFYRTILFDSSTFDHGLENRVKQTERIEWLV